MRRVTALVFAFICLLLTVPTGGQSSQSPTFGAVGLQPKQGYFSQLPFESVDMVNGNLIFTFTDLVLPGDAGMDLAIQRSYNRQEGIWRFGLPGVPMQVLDPYPGSPEGDPAQPAKLIMADGSIYNTTPRDSVSATDVWVSEQFLKYTVASREIELPNGLVAKYSSGLRRLLEYVEDRFGNRISVTWEIHPSPSNTYRPSAFTQTVGGVTRDVTFTYDTPIGWMPATMTFAGKQWQYSYADDSPNLLEVADPPDSEPWTFDYTGTTGLLVTTPAGGTVNYTFEQQTFPDEAPVSRWVLRTRSTGGRDIVPGTWSFNYDPQSFAHLGSFGTVTGPGGRGLEFRHDWAALAQRWVLKRKAVRENGHDVAVVTRSYRTLSIAAWTDSLGTVPVIEHESIEQDGVTYQTFYSYSDNDEAHHFGDRHRPHRIEEVGPAGTRVTTQTFDYDFDFYVFNRVSAETVTVGNESFTTSRDFNNSTGFLSSQTVYGVTTTFEPDAHGNTASIRDANNEVTTIEYQWGVAKNTFTPEYPITRVINSDGTVAEETRRGLTTKFFYDGLGRVTELRPPGTISTLTRYFADRVEVERGPNVTTTYVDGFGRTTSTSSAGGIHTAAEYDSEGSKTRQSYTFDASTGDRGDTFAYDALGRVTTVTHPDGSTITYDYDGGFVEKKDEENHRTTQQWKGFGSPSDTRLTGVVDARGKQWSYDYNALGRLTRVRAPDQTERTWEYDGHNWLKVERHPESGTVRYEYDAVGNVRQKTDALREVTYDYDGNNRLTRIRTPDGIDDVEIDYNASDNRTYVKNALVETTYHFDDDSPRLDDRTDVIAGRTYVTSYGYDNRGNVTRIDYPSGRYVTYGYDAADRISSVRGNAAGLPEQDYATGIEYHPSGALRSFTYGNAQQETITFENDRFRPRRVQSGPLDLTYDYDGVGNVTAITDPRPDKSSTLEYDEVDRLLVVRGFGARRYSYDDLGNRLTKGLPDEPPFTTYGYESQRLRTINGPGETGALEYDPLGNMTADNSGATFTYTTFNMLATATVAGVESLYGYDGDNLRAYRTTPSGTFYYIRGADAETLAEYDATDGLPQLLREYVYLGSRLLVSFGRGAVPDPPLKVRITNPRNNEAFPNDEALEIQADASVTTPGDTVARVEFYRDGILIGQDTSAPYSLSWTPNLPAGTYRLLARVVTTGGQAATSAGVNVRFFLVGRITGVTVTPTPLAAGQQATITVTGNANLCGAVGINYGDGTAIIYPYDQALAEQPFVRTYTWTSGGTKTITATGHGNCRGSVSTTITLTGPQVAITSPAPNTSYQPPATITIEADATDTGGSTISRVEFFAGATLLGTDTAAPFSFTWTGVPLGSYQLTAKAFNAFGVSATSAVVPVAVTNLAGLTISPATVGDNQEASLTVTGANPCGALRFDFGDGPSYVLPISALPFTTTHAWTTGGIKTVVVSGEANCTGTVSGTVTVVANQRPQVALTSPANGATFPGPATVNLAANANDADGSIAKVEFFAGATLLATDTAAPYAFTWTNVADGTHVLTAKATDNLGGTTTSAAVTISVTRQITSVSVSPASVMTGQAATVTVSGSPGCGAVTIDYGDGTVITYPLSGLPFSQSHSWTTGGTKTITATGQANCGGAATTTVSVTANAPPSVTLTSPAHGAAFASPATIALAANASDSDGSVARVEFYSGTTLLATDTSAPYAFTWSSVSDGTYSITAQAVDNFGARTTSAAASVTVSARVTGVSVSPGSVVTGQAATVTVAGSPGCGAATINYGDGTVITYPLSGLPFSQSHTWSTGGTKTITATGQGNCAGSATTTLAVNTNPAPTVTLTSPANGAAFASPTSISLTATASDPDGSVVRVEFYAGATLLATDTAAPYAFTWSSVPDGAYSITAQAVDNFGARTTSAAANVTVGPRVTGVSVSPGSIVTGQSASVTVTGSPGCTAAGIDYGDGTSIVYAISSLPMTQSHTWSTAGTKTITATGHGSCAGSATTSLAVSTNPPPAVSMTSPASGSAYTSGTVITLAASASDGHGLARVEFYAGGTLLGTDTTSPYALNWSVASGTTSLTARAVDIYGATTTSSPVSVTGRDVVSVSLYSGPPTAGDTATIYVAGSSSCGAVTLNYGDGTVITYAISGLPITRTHVWATGGTKTVTATGQSTCVGQASTNIYVNHPPVIAITSPANGNTYVGPAAINYQVSATDADGSILAVDFYANGVNLGTDTTAPYSLAWNNVPAGYYTLQAVTIDNAGAVRYSSPIGITVNNPGPSMLTSLVAPATVPVGQTAVVTTYGTNPCGVVHLNWGDGVAWHHAITELPYSYGYAWSAPGTYTITATGHGNCSGQVTTTITVTGPPEPEPVSSPEFVPAMDAALTSEATEESESTDDHAIEMERAPEILTEAHWLPEPPEPPQATATLVVNLMGTGTGTVTSSPAGISCVGGGLTGTSCTGTFTAGQLVTLTPSPDPNKTFAGWDGACSGTSTCTITVTGTQLAVATFSVPPPMVTQYYHLDLLGSVRAVTSDQNPAQVIRRHDYLAFGEEASADEAIPLPEHAKQQRYTGKPRDEETELDYFGQRYSRAGWGRFTTVDPELGAALGLVDPQRWNRYSYVGNRPTVLVDLDGRSWWSKLVKLVIKGGDVASTFAGMADDFRTLKDDSKTAGERTWAGISLASEALPASVGDVKDVGKWLGISGTVSWASRRSDDAGVSVYRSLDGNVVQYVGITNNLARRQAEHLRNSGMEIEELLSGLTRSEAKAVEQALIEIHGLGRNGGSLRNKINSIAATNPAYADQLRRGLHLLESIGYH